MRSPALNLRALLAAIAMTIACSRSTCAHAQATPSAPASTSPAAPATAKALAYADESIVIERAETLYTYAADGTGTMDRSVVARLQSDAAVRSLGVVSIAYAADSQHVEFLYARVRHPDGAVVESTPADAIDMPQPVTREAPFYSDLKEKQLPIRSLRVGDTLEWKARITTTKSQASGQIWGQETFVDDSVVLAESIELRVPAGIAVKVWSPTAKPAESDSPAGGATPALHIYRWTSSQLKPTAGKEAEAAAEAKKKTVWTADQELDVDQGKLPTIAWTTFKSWQEVGAWYRSLEADRVTPSPEIKAKVAELIAGKSTDEEKVRALYAYVATQIRYIGVAFGIGRYQPHTAAEILGNQYGDCKDKHTLLASMLSAAGIPADAVLIGAGVRFNPDVPSPSAFNHLITHLALSPAPGQPPQPIWLDTTTEIAPYRMLVSVVRDKLALVVPSPPATAPYIDRTPADPPFATFQTMEATGTLDKDGVAHSHISLSVRGDTELIFREAFHRNSPGQYNEVVQQISYGIGYGGKTSNADVSRPENTAEPFKMSYDYQRDKTPDWDNQRIIPQVAPVALVRFSDSDPLVRDLVLGTPRVETSHAAIKIPDGWGTVLPEASHHKCAYVTYDETYRFEKGTIYTERRIEILKQKVPAADLKTYKKWADDASLGEEQYIRLTPGYDIPPRPIPPSSEIKPAQPSEPAKPENAPAVANDDPASLMQKAADLYQQGHYFAIPDLLDQVKKTNPEQQYLWSAYGSLAVIHGQLVEATDDFEKEIRLHPDSLRAYEPLIRLLQTRGLKPEEIAALRAWTAAAPPDPKPISLLLSALIAYGDPRSAATMGEAAQPRLAGDAQQTEYFRTQLGTAELKSGETAKGKAMLEAVLAETDSFTALNDAAYNLADTNLDLPLAEKSIRKALDKVTEGSNSWTLDEDPNQLRHDSLMIAAVWDSVGWILFRAGKLDEAQGYLQAAWRAAPDEGKGDHLGDLLAARGSKSAAMAIYELALAKGEGYDGMGARLPPTPAEKRLQRKVDALNKAGIKSTVGTTNDPYEVLRRIDTIKLGEKRSGDDTATAIYLVLLKDGKAVKTRQAGARSIEGAPDWLAKADFSTYFPAGSHATLFRTANVTCYGKFCELTLYP
jgi:tetratricopeptide (TPR) repeat protein